ncbi:MAG: CBS domain-containing protein [Planctomycetaceae bacterium]|nr:CBS domain-containing protein [Planctomycetaceae bacterium]
MNSHQNANSVLTAQDIMSDRVKTLSPDTPVPEAIHTMLANNYTGMPIADSEGNYRGVFSEKCCMRVLTTLVDLAEEPISDHLLAREIMIPRSRLFTVKPDDDVFDAVNSLLKHNFSGAPVIDSDGTFMGVLSEKTCMSLVIEAAYDGLPTATVRGFIDNSMNRLIQPDTTLYHITKIFRETSLRRLPVIDHNEIVGQISRRDVINDSRILSCIIKHHLDDPLDSPRSMTEESMIIMAAQKSLPEQNVSGFADEEARTIGPDVDIFSIAHLFHCTPYRRFPVVQDGKLIGLVSRCDVLRASFGLLNRPQETSHKPLFLSAVTSAEDSQIWTR